MLDELKNDSGNSQSESLESQSLAPREWSTGALKKKFSDRNIESLFWKYGFQLHRGYFSIFLFVQTTLILVHIGFLIFYGSAKSSPNFFVDILGYLGAELILGLLTAFIFKKNLVKKHSWLPDFATALGIGSTVVVDIALQIYHTASFHSRSLLRPAYPTHALIACHIFYPQNDNIASVVLGVTVALLYIAELYFVTYRRCDNILIQISADITFFICINFLGIYFRYINEIFIRSGFLDKRACVESTLKLNYEKETEEQLMLSILPRHLASRVQEDLVKKHLCCQKEKRMMKNPYSELYVERHNDVSILYADVVNYTKMTSSLPANRLVEILNELFGRFDEASEKHRVLRIKFLGDCYYCVSGVPQPNPNHARSCVDLAVEMIQIIKDVREANDLNIDMRIGIHSGSILCGILGKCKWQYDIWSKDVIIANHMEQSGRSGMVHITRQTLEKLGSRYNVEPGFGHTRDELLAKCNIETFFIIPEIKNRYSYFTGVKQTDLIPPEGMQTSIIWRIPSASQQKNKNKCANDSNDEDNIKQHGIDTMFSLKRVISGGGHLVLSRRRGGSDAIMNQQRLNMADANMEKDIEKLPLGKINPSFQQKKVHYFRLGFDGIKHLEKSYLQQPDPLFGYYVASALLVFFCIAIIQFLISDSWTPFSYAVYGFSALILTLLLPLTWTHFLWRNVYHTEGIQSQNIMLKFLYNASLNVVQNALIRIIVYIVVSVILASCLIIKLLEIGSKPNGNKSNERDVFSKTKVEEFLGPWQMTEVCNLAIVMSFLFFRIRFQLKLMIALVISALYIYCMCKFNDVFGHSDTWNPDMPPLASHILSVLFLVFELHLADRQTECVSRLDYCWKKHLMEEKEKVRSTSAINKSLLQNILPIHVAEIYLKNRSSDELYHENYECVSVMFASLTNYSLYNESDNNLQDTESHSLQILNRIVCCFDDALLQEFKRIEKIKVAGWTYMAACGLAPGTTDSSGVLGGCNCHVILLIVKFAAQMMRILKKINEEYSTDFGLRVGISHGPVTAGVVGSHRPYYDIWGNTVNVASRMDSTGEAGKIQIPEQTAQILREEGVDCDYRGNIFVKGKGNMDTYYVKLTEDSFLTENRNREDPDIIKTSRL